MKLLIVSALVFALPFVTFATDYQGRCSIAFQATSTLHDFDGTGECQPFSVSEIAGVLTVPELRVAVSGMDTDNSKRDKQMRKMFNVDEYPLITGLTGAVLLEDLRTALKESADSVAEVRFFLKIRDIEQPVTALLQNVAESDSTITADLVFSLSLDDYQLKPPSVLGFIRVGDNVDVTASFSLELL